MTKDEVVRWKTDPFAWMQAILGGMTSPAKVASDAEASFGPLGFSICADGGGEYGAVHCDCWYEGNACCDCGEDDPDDDGPDGEPILAEAA